MKSSTDKHTNEQRNLERNAVESNYYLLHD